MNRKAQFGPDALVGIVLIAALGLGGIFFLHTFVNSLNMESFISIMDTELDQKCFYTMLPMVGGDYVRSGDNVTDNPHFNSTQIFFGGNPKYRDVSYNFEKQVNLYTFAMKNYPLYGKSIVVKGYLASKEVAGKLRKEIFDYSKENNLPTKQVCYMPAYGPGGKFGTVELYMFEKESGCGKEGHECCVGGYCDVGLTCQGGLCEK